MIAVLIFTILFSALTYGVLVLGVDNRRLRNRLEESEATVKAYDDAAAKHNARADRAERERDALHAELKAAEARLKQFDHRSRKRNEKGWFVK